MIGELINCMARTYDGRCAMCAVCRIVLAIESIVEPDQLANIARHVDRIGDELGVISERVEEL
jgi:hypothetical protein